MPIGIRPTEIPPARLGLGWLAIILVGAVCCASLHHVVAGEVDAAAAKRGYEFLLNTPLVPADFPEAIFDQAWTQWPEPLRTQAEKASPEARRRMAFSRYGLTTRPNDDSGKPLQYVVGDDGQWTINCFGCHGGKVAGKVIPGLPNSLYAMQTIVEETRAVKLAKGAKFGRMDIGSAFVPLGSSNGTTNAVMFGVVLMNFRDADLNWHDNRSPPKLDNHDMDAPPWWHFKRKEFIYIDGFASKGHRGLLQFAMVRQNKAERLKAWEDSFRDVYAYIESVESPKYPFPIDRELAAQGEAIFNESCAECHGTYGKDSHYPALNVAIEKIGTDRVRFDALTPERRKAYGDSWYNDYGKKPNIASPEGYVAPPLDGIWASAPYFHNGSVPTLWHVLNSKERPAVWKRTEDGYDQKHVGLEIESFEKLPAKLSFAEQRTYFDSSSLGKSAKGHTFPDKLSVDEKWAVLEYLKSL